MKELKSTRHYPHRVGDSVFLVYTNTEGTITFVDRNKPEWVKFLGLTIKEMEEQL